MNCGDTSVTLPDAIPSCIIFLYFFHLEPAKESDKICAHVGF